MYGRADIDDASADFDCVIDDAGSSTRDKLVFTALDGTGRTDTWLGNKQEFSEGTDPLDPDTDDDGLTDGQEVKGLTKQTSFWGRTSLTEDPICPLGQIRLTLIRTETNTGMGGLASMALATLTT